MTTPVADLSYREIARALRNGRDLGPATYHLKGHVNDHQALVRSVDLILAGRTFARDHERALAGMPHAVDALDLLLLRMQGIHAAAACCLAAGMGSIGLKCEPPADATYAVVWPSHQPVRGGKVIVIAPTLAPGVIKHGRSIHVAQRLPLQMQQSLPSMARRPLSALLAHPHLDGLALRITSVATREDRFWIRLGGLPEEDVRLAHLTPEETRPLGGPRDIPARRTGR